MADIPDCLAALTNLRVLDLKSEPAAQQLAVQALQACSTLMRLEQMIIYVPGSAAPAPAPAAALAGYCNHPCLCELVANNLHVDGDVLRILATIPKLEVLCVFSVDIPAATVAILSSVVNLRFVECRTVGKPLAAVTPQLTKLGCARLPQNTAHPNLFSPLTLEVVLLSHACPSLAPMLSRLPKLQCLRLALEPAQFAGVPSFLQPLTRLSALELLSNGECTVCDDSFVEALVPMLPRLASLTLPQRSSISDQSLVILSQGLMRLRTLKIDSASGITPVGVLMALSSTSLVTLHLVRCPQATAALCADVLRARHALGLGRHAEVVFEQ